MNVRTERPAVIRPNKDKGRVRSAKIPVAGWEIANERLDEALEADPGDGLTRRACLVNQHDLDGGGDRDLAPGSDVIDRA